MHCCQCQCHCCIACCCQPVDCCSLFFQKISCYALPGMLPTPLTLLQLPAVDCLHPFTHLLHGHSWRQRQCYCAMMQLPLPCISVLYSCCLLDALFTVAAIAISLAVHHSHCPCHCFPYHHCPYSCCPCLALSLLLPSMPLPFPFLCCFHCHRHRHHCPFPFPCHRCHCPCRCRRLLVASSNFCNISCC